MKENTTDRRDVVIVRIINAPVEVVWNAWTEPQAIRKWWGPEDYTSPSATVDLREGGKYVFSMAAPKEQGGVLLYIAGMYSKIVPMICCGYAFCIVPNIHYRRVDRRG